MRPNKPMAQTHLSASLTSWLPVKPGRLSQGWQVLAKPFPLPSFSTVKLRVTCPTLICTPIMHKNRPEPMALDVNGALLWGEAVCHLIVQLLQL